MKMFPTLLPFALIATHAVATPLAEGCALRMSEIGSMVTVQGAVDPQDWPRGSYEMTIEARQGGNRSLSQQAGKFDNESAQTADGLFVLSTTKVYVSNGGSLAVTLRVEDGDRNVSCSLDYN
ncbi:curli-like amyloid fiber formation chaperone CsgH [Loktanella sp. M215]|uniref:curli-like amyloid fiber formation chaperone CsgH n=1 Tax=Loktanella sp. M215 TaxID=2675431 RepID=UPI001F2DE647|nr:curli-like amyloid fiber formation chaperone CsgH [Loktanella sp. M215]MCF7702490.1 hypothetical protein [Loktanella sp. M215]